MKVDFHVPEKDNLWREPLILDLRLRTLGIKDRMVFKHPISAGEDPDMPLFVDIYGVDGFPFFRQILQLLEMLHLRFFLNYSRKSQIMM